MDINPTVINQAMLEEAIQKQRKQGEIMRLSQDNPMDWKSVSGIRLEFKGILRIDHLWPLKNLTRLSLNYNKIETIENLDELTLLKELDLSFNYIERIEKLGKLVKLEILSLFSNRIETIENLEGLKELIILNLGSNKINTLSGFERLRFLPKLRVFNLENNPLKDAMNVRQLVSAYLPNLKYYNYTHVSQEERETAAKIYSRELRELGEREGQEIFRLTTEVQLARENAQHHECFIEDLSGHQLFEKLFEDDLFKDSRAKELSTRLKDQIYILTQRIFVAGLKHFQERQEEVNEFRICLDNAKRLNQTKGQGIICNLQKKCPLRQSLEPALIEVTWKELMDMEVQLFEAIEDVSKRFGFIIDDLVNQFLKDTQSVFRQIKERIDDFFEKMSLFLNEASHHTNQNCQEDWQLKWKRQRKLIDEREFKMQERAREWSEELLASFKEEEIQRNRRKVIEINYFLDSLRTI